MARRSFCLFGVRWVGLAMAVAMGIGSPAGASMETALEALESGRLDEADRLLTRMLRDQPADPEVNFALGRVAMARGKTSHAVFAFERVLDVTPGNHRARLELARAHALMGRYDLAEAYFEEVLESDPPEAVRENVRSYLDAMASAASRWSVRGQVQWGVFHDDNVNYGPEDARIDTLLGTLVVSPDAEPASTWGTSLSGAGELGYDPGFRGSWTTHAKGQGYRSWLDDEKAQEIGYSRVGGGARHGGDRHLFEVTGYAGLLRYGGQDLVRTIGADPTLFLVHEGRWRSEWQVSGEHRDYVDSTARDALYAEGKMTWHKELSAAALSKLLFGMGGFVEDAELDGLSNQGWFVRAGAETAWFGPGRLYSDVTFRSTEFDEILYADLQQDPRDDEQLQITAGVQFSIGPSMSLDLNNRYVRQTSNFGLYAYDRHVTSLTGTLSF